MKSVADFVFEVGILAKTPRSGLAFLGSGSQSIAEHSNRVCYIGYALAMMDGTVDPAKVIQMCLFHDLAEGRTLDHNYVHQKYVTVDEHKAIADITEKLPFGSHMRGVLEEYEARQSKESLIAKDADNLELIVTLKEQWDLGNKRAKDWLDSSIKRLKTEVGQKLGAQIMETPYDDWRYENKEDNWWVNRNKEQQ